MLSTIEIALESPDQPEIRRMLAHSDASYQALYPEESNHLADVARLGRDDVTFYVARLSHVACGFGALFDFGAYGEIKRMYVDQPARGKGIGREILDALETHARHRGFTVLKLETGIRQPAAIALYRRCGYTDITAFGDYPDDPLSVFLEKRLT